MDTTQGAGSRLRDAAYSRDYYAKNADAIKARHRSNHAANRDKINERRRLNRYNITKEQHDALWDAQGHKCGVCGTDAPGKRGWHIDHCHATNVVRGILCMECNTGLGKFKDDPDVLRKAIDYLGRAPSTTN